jgi:hypothetical protein
VNQSLEHLNHGSDMLSIYQAHKSLYLWTNDVKHKYIDVLIITHGGRGKGRGKNDKLELNLTW